LPRPEHLGLDQPGLTRERSIYSLAYDTYKKRNKYPPLKTASFSQNASGSFEAKMLLLSSIRIAASQSQGGKISL